jgi:hypothetical protein
MSINDATPQDWDKVAQTGEPTFEEYMTRLDSKYVYDSTENYGDEVTSDAGDFKDCWNAEWHTDKVDPVNAPVHYNAGSIECIEAIEESMSADAFRGYLKGNCMKYLWRYSYKGKSLEDVQKAQWYLKKLVGALGG